MSFVDRLPSGERAFLVGVVSPGSPSDLDSLEELARLAKTAGARVVGAAIQKRGRISVSTYIGQGKLTEIADEAKRLDVDLVIFDNDLSPAQGRNIERDLSRRVIDRTELILDIFALHARTREAMLQIELAQLTYALPRLKRLWTHLSRMKRGIGTRGPGETQLESDRRLVKKRIVDLSRELRDVVERRTRQVRSRATEFRVSLVGYTNAGKSSLFRKLTGENVLVQDQLFSTLDTKTRSLRLPGKPRVLLSDTVGFIRDLPHSLVASFHATLAEVLAADLLLHVVDASAIDVHHQIEAVESVLKEIGADAIPTILVLNKTDIAEDRSTQSMVDPRRDVVLVSALRGDGIQRLMAHVSRRLDERRVEVELFVPEDRSTVLARLARIGEILETTVSDGGLRVVAVVEPKLIPSIQDAGARVISRSHAQRQDGSDSLP